MGFGLLRQKQSCFRLSVALIYEHNRIVLLLKERFFMKKFILPVVLMASISLGACENMQNAGMKEKIGSVIGAVGGGYAGSKVGGGSGQLWATAAGTLLGAWAGNEIGKSLDKADLMYAQQAEAKAYEAPIGQQVSWNNPESGNYGTVTPVRDGSTESGDYCREYEQTIYIGGRAETGVGVACQREDGKWEVIS
jgi:surface antigen